MSDAKMNVPFLDIKAQNRSIWPELQEALDRVTSQAQFILGPAVERFEKAFSAYVGRECCVGLNNGTSALHMALQACDVGPGDEVVTTPHTWISTSWAISYVGAKPVYVDIDPATYNINPALIERAITPRTKAILPVHLYGQACDMDALCGIAKKHNLLLIEDAAQAHGATYGGKRIGSFGRISCFSFYPGKNLGAFGEGGAVATDDEALAERIRRLRDHAQAGRHHHVELGHNTRMEGIQGAVLEVKLRHLDDWNAARARHAQQYHELLADVPGIQLPAGPGARCPRLASIRGTGAGKRPRRSAKETGRTRRCHGRSLPHSRSVAAGLCLLGAQVRRLPRGRRRHAAMPLAADVSGTDRRTNRLHGAGHPRMCLSSSSHHAEGEPWNYPGNRS